MPKTTYVWDHWIRLSHWLIAVLIPANYWLLEPGEPKHEWVGYLLLALILARVIWGVYGSPNARIKGFFPYPKALIAYIKLYKVNKKKTTAQLANYHKNKPGHNPLGALMIVFLWAVILIISITGWLQTTDKYWGEEWVQNLHSYSANTILITACLHIAAVFFMQIYYKQSLIKPMITGYRKTRD